MMLPGGNALNMLRQRSPKRLQALALLSALAIAFSGLSLASPTPAQAADARDFNAGNIISDALFYDGNAMTASEVQTFLNQRVPRCTIGDAGRTAGMQWGNTVIASKCLRDYTMSTITRPANAYCGAYVGRSSETAAEIITRVAQACGISQRVLLITLEKEQSLVTDSWPTVRQIDVATGYACPDSGPNWSANCNPEYYGFQNQVYYAAWQLKVYKAFPNSYNYKPFQWNTIQYNPNPACGTSQVYIENWATAALYIYTPYRPNQAALNAQWGTGDGCSSYGNRNFFMLYSTWFGLTQGTNYPQIDAKYAQSTWLGAAVTGYNQQTASGGGVIRGYQNGAITWQTGKANAYVISGDFRSYYGAQGGVAGDLGWPTSDEIDRGVGRTQAFDGGAVSWTESSGFAVVATGAIRTHYADWALAYSGPLGWPTANVVCTSTNNCSQSFEQGLIALNGSTVAIKVPAIETAASSNAGALGSLTQTPKALSANGGGFVQAHQNGAIAWTSAHGAYVISGKIREAFNANGGISGTYGWPINEQICDSNGCSQSFTGGTIRVDTTGTTVSMAQAIEDAYRALADSGTELGASLGSTATITANGGGLVHAFQNGALAYSDRTGAYAVMAPIRAPFNALGGLTGALGWPTSNARSELANGGGIVQGFEGGAITITDSGTFVLSGVMRTAFAEYGGLTGALGWPLTNSVQQTVSGGGSVQAFQGGALVLPSGASSPFLLSGEIRRVFSEAGGLAGTPGWPTGNVRMELANGSGQVQGFQNVAIVSSSSGTFIISGQIRAFFNSQGGLTGSLGWPTSAASIVGDEQRQSFQNGTIVLNSRTGVAQIAQ